MGREPGLHLMGLFPNLEGVSVVGDGGGASRVVWGRSSPP